MTVREVQVRVQEIADIASGHPKSPARDAYAHEAEDRLHKDVLRAIADGAADPERLAIEALSTSTVEFGRWYE